MDNLPTVTCDVLVVGTGAAGLTAAVTAKKAGLDVLVVEKEPVFGGTTATSGATVWIPMNPHGLALGAEDSLDDVRTYLRAMMGNRYDEARVEAFLANGPEMVRFLEAETEVKFTGAIRPEYFPDLPGSRLGRSMQIADYDVQRLGPRYRQLKSMLTQTLFMGIAIGSSLEMKKYLTATRSLSSFGFVASRLLLNVWDTLRYGRSSQLPRGLGLIARLARTLFDLEVPLWLSSPAKRPIVRDGRVCGAVVERQDGSVEVIARRGVILACGGFPGDWARRNEVFAHERGGKRHPTLTPLGNTGDGLRFAEAAGGAFTADVAQPAAWMPMSIIPGRPEASAAYPHIVDRQKPGFIAVGLSGRRFGNEAGSYHEFVPAMIRAIQEDGGDGVFLVCDRKAINKWGLGYVKPFPVPRGEHLRSGYLRQGRTLAELAARIGVDPKGLEETVQAYNLHARDGKDPAFGRGQSAFDQFSGDPAQTPNPNLAPLDQGPFFAVKMVPGEIGTFAGLRTSANAEVLDARGVPVPGLYAVGNDAASLMGGTYPAAGITLGPGMTFGYIAARRLAAQAADAGEPRARPRAARASARQP